MSDRPSVLQTLKDGLALCGKNFPNFVNTWNWLVNAFDNLRGDADINNETGHIKIDRTDPKHPVVRLTNFGTLGGGGGGGGRYITNIGYDSTSGYIWVEYNDGVRENKIATTPHSEIDYGN